MIILYAPYPSIQSARKAARNLLGKKLIACANITQSVSVYGWKSKMKNGKESIALFKTLHSRERACRREIEKTHPYELPCIITLDAHANREFEKWVGEQTRI
ncbi:MAG TPA: divalent-cation tolerance protein CutA [Candidatus Diapherotrites archaeon]|uniref:Divalent-cation tolerance protein CutA n=1 Tax=Candidatus Iainarchaeum sp. TaxID=3101447 RepID=A0A7J4IZJ6_9ARCH|nr:divalent-cation tolerance protein CutA [Candidatus Diapherotrites archaeon]